MSSELLPGWTQFARRIAGAGRLQSATYRELSWDRGALPQAVLIILLSSLASAAVFLVEGSVPSLSFDVNWERYPVTRESNAFAALVGAVLDGGWGLIAWAVQATMIWWLWNRFSVRRREWHMVAVPLGFANVPLVPFALLQLVPIIGGVLGSVGLLWTLVASFVAVREGLSIGWARAILLVFVSMGLLLPIPILISYLS